MVFFYNLIDYCGEITETPEVTTRFGPVIECVPSI